MAEIAKRGSQASGRIRGAGLSTATYPSRLYAWYVVAVLMVAYTFSFIDRQILSLLVGPMERDLQISDTQVSLLQGFAFALFYTLLGLPIGRMVDSRSRIGIISLGVFVWSLMTGMCGMAKAYWQLFIFRMGVGVGEAALSPAAYSVITDSFPPKGLGLALGVYSMGIYIGSGLALVIGAEVVGFVSQGGNFTLPLIGDVYNWQVVFFVVGFPGVLIALWARTLIEPVRHGMVRAVAGGPASASISLGKTLGYLIQNAAAFLFMTLCLSFVALTAYGTSAWVPAFFVRTYGWNIVEAGRWYGWIIILFGTTGVVAGGAAGDFLKQRGVKAGRIWIMIVGAAGMLPGAWIFPLVDDPTVALYLLVPTVFFSTVGFGTGPAALQEMMPNQMRGLAAAVSLFLINLIGLGLGPTTYAWTTEHIFEDKLMLRYSLSYVSIGTLSVAVLFGLLALRPYAKSLTTLEYWKADHGAQH
jgi:MFS family permease